MYPACWRCGPSSDNIHSSFFKRQIFAGKDTHFLVKTIVLHNKKRFRGVVLLWFDVKKRLRGVFPQVPPKVEYSLTETGKSLMPAISSLIDWAYQHFDDVVPKDLVQK